MNKLIKFLDGKKTYISALLIAIFGVVKAFGVELTPDQDFAILTLLGALLTTGIGGKLDKLK
jgi:hypothetical protein